MAPYILGMIAAFAVGIYIGLGFPGLPGREDRVLRHNRRRRVRRTFTPIDWFKPPKV